MTLEDMTNEQLMKEIKRLQKRIADLEELECGRKKLADEIVKKDKFLSDIMNAITHPFYVINTDDYSIEMANAAASAGREKIEPRTCYRISHHNDKPCAGPNDICTIEEVKRTGKGVVLEHIHYDKDGNRMYVEVHGYPIFNEEGKITKVIEYSLDITARKWMDEALVKSENKFRCLFESSRDAIMTLEPPGWKFTTGNPSTVRMFKAKDEADFTSHEPWALSPEYQPDGRASAEKAKAMIETAMREGSHFFEWTHKRLTGEEFPATVLLTRMALGEKTFLQATVRDITKEKKTRKMLESSENYLVSIIDSVADPIFVKDREHRWVKFNSAFCKFMGRDAKDIQDKSDYAFFPKTEADVFWAKDEEVFLNGLENTNEEFFTDAKGVRRTIVTKKTLYKNPAGKEYIVGVIRDVTV
ncbi:MAG: hypothetical protein AUJ71_00050 [Candidatus Omnitrophica bacterium CG1_02_49_16]|nr:MAG: hypothetical protein AUJ71_00050 [Candidatus Omnitrophica bacterium CG1_02_49_16]